MPIFRFDQDQYGHMYVSEYFYRSQRGQYGGEGYMASALCLAISGAFYGMVQIPRWFKESGQRKVAVVCAVIVAWGLIQVFLTIYRLKTPWYQTSFLPPGDYIRGPIMRD